MGKLAGGLGDAVQIGAAALRRAVYRLIGWIDAANMPDGCGLVCSLPGTPGAVLSEAYLAPGVEPAKRIIT